VERPPPPGDVWPRISIVTPSHNRADLIEETIRSVLLQGYPDLEYVIIDGGSTDGTVEVIRKYEQWLSFWTTEPDEGISDAINKGLPRATGEVVSYLNTDDVYVPGALVRVGRCFADPGVDWFSGRGRLFGPGVGWGYTWPRRPWRKRWQWLVRNCLVQPSTFWRREVTERIGYFDTDLKVSMDHEYWLRMISHGYELTWTDEILSRFRIHAGSVTGAWSSGTAREGRRVRERYMHIVSPKDRKKVQRALRKHEARRLRWRAWRRAWAGEPRAALADLKAAVGAAPGILLSARTWAVPVLALISTVRRLPPRYSGRGERDSDE
jgi:glycosyltransferase involved in cell wall biosynthesis